MGLISKYLKGFYETKPKILNFSQIFKNYIEAVKEESAVSLKQF